MATIVDVSQLTLNPEEVREASQIIFEKIYNNPAIADIHEIEVGIRMKEQIVFSGRIGMVGKAAAGCTPNSAPGFTMTQKYWDPATEDFRLVHCQKDLNALFKVFNRASRMNPDFYDIVGSEQMGIIVTAVENAMLESLMVKAWFADTAAATVENSGVFKNGTDIALFNSFNGLFKQIITENGGSNPTRVTISKNGGANYAAQALAADEGYGFLKDMYNKADSRLLSQPNAFFLVTRSIFDNYVDTLENKSLSNGFLERAENGTLTVQYRGIPVINMGIWDRTIKAYQDNGTKLNLPHRAVLTVKENIPLGTLSTQDLGSLDVFYNQVTKSNYIDAAYTIDAKHLESYLTVLAI